MERKGKNTKDQTREEKEEERRRKKDEKKLMERVSGYCNVGARRGDFPLETN